MICGQNNVGKSALIEALSFEFPGKPHRSEKTVPDRRRRPLDVSTLRFSIEVPRGEVKGFLARQQDGDSISVPGMPPNPETREAAERALRFVRDSPNLVLNGTRTGQNVFTIDEDSGFWPPTPNLDNRGWHMFSGGQWQAGVQGQPFLDLRLLLVHDFRAGVFAFRAERMNIGLAPHGMRDVLLNDASNLPEVLNVLQNNAPRFAKYNALVHRVLPNVVRASVRSAANTKLEIMVWSGSADSERDDLAVPLAESGTGVSQVLAMLYVLSTAEFPRTILVDEPNSFLHPGAVAELLKIFLEHDEHQYIVTTHSPSVVSALNPQRLYLLELVDRETRIRPVSAQDVHDQRSVLDAVGARLSDVFGPDRILWVEGESEVRCFPLIATHHALQSSGVAFVSLANTADFNNERYARKAVDIYRRLAAGVGLVPPACGFVLDSECRSAERRTQIEQAAPGRLRFLQRRMYENYLLHPEAIAAWLNQKATFRDRPRTDAQIVEWISGAWDRNADQRFGATHHPQHQRREWQEEVDGARLLDALASELSEQKESYDKVMGAPLITKWLLEHKPEELAEVAEILKELIRKSA